MKIYLILVFFGYLFTVITGYWLKALNLRYLKKYGATVPPEFKGQINEELLIKTRSYTIENSRFSIVKSVFDNVVLVVFLFGGLLNIYNSWINSLGWHFILSGLAFFFVLFCAETVISIPFSLYSTFRIENKYGFNTQTPKLWLTDLFKSILLSAVLTGILVSAGLWLVDTNPYYWWLWVWVFFLCFSLFIMYISPYVIEPLFNKFTPVEDEELKQKIKNLAQKAGIKVSSISKMDASKRSRHTNAYFSGIGRVKRIILYDTLLEKMCSEEIIAVLAHEIGHWKKRHVLKRIVVSEIIALAALYISFTILQSDFLLKLFSIETESFFPKIVILGFFAGIISFFFNPLSGYFSRRHEREADRFATGLTGDAESLAISLVKLSKDNLSNLYPHPLYAAFYYSHSPVVQRIREIRGQSG